MKKVAVITNTHERCGIAEYGRNLIKELQKYYELCSSWDAEVLIVNWNRLRVPIEADTVRRWQLIGKKVIILHHDTHPTRNEFDPKLQMFGANATVVHEPVMGCWKYIPHGIVEVDNLPTWSENTIGVAGFPFPWKRFDIAVAVAAKLDADLLMMAPAHEFYNPASEIEKWKNQLGSNLTVITDWLPVDEVVRKLASCTLTMFWFQSLNSDDECGQSGSALMGVSAKRPMIISSHRKLAQLHEYPQDFYIANTEHELMSIAEDILDGKLCKVPKTIMKDMSWSQMGLKFKELIDEV